MLEGLRDAELLWKLARAGTCSAVHLRRMELEKIGTLPIDNDKLRSSFPGMRPGISAAVTEISLSNKLNVGPAVPAVKMPRPREPLNICFWRACSPNFGVEQILVS